jgi:hypothetical protein
MSDTDLITSELLEDFGPTIQSLFKLVFPNGITLGEIGAQDHQVFKIIYKHFKGE